MKDYILAADAARLVGKSPRGLRRLYEKNNDIKRKRVGNKWWYKVPDKYLPSTSWLTIEEMSEFLKKTIGKGSHDAIRRLASLDHLDKKKEGKTYYKIKSASMKRIVDGSHWLSVHNLKKEYNLSNLNFSLNFEKGNVEKIELKGMGYRWTYYNKINKLEFKKSQSERAQEDVLGGIKLLTKNQVCYIAGIIDTNANISIKNDKASVQIRMTSAILPDWLKLKIPGSHFYQSKGGVTKNPISMWSVDGIRAVEFLNVLQPYVIAKNSVVNAVLDHHKVKELISEETDVGKITPLFKEKKALEDTVYLEMSKFFMKDASKYRGKYENKKK